MRRILFVDDDPNEIKELKTMLKSICQKCEIEFALSGEEALNFMLKSPFDVVVFDMRMQGRDGMDFLGTVMERYPETVRIIHSELSDAEMVLRSSKSAHQLLEKPNSAEAIKCTIERTCKLQDLLRSEELKNIVASIKKLPSNPKLYNLITAEMQSPDASLKKVGHIISQDVSMTAKILQLVNSPYFGLQREIADPQQAAVYLGMDKLKTLVLSINVFSSFTGDAESCGFSLVEMQRHSLRTSKLAWDIVRAETDDRKVAEEAMIAGMLHDVGKLIMLKIPKQYNQVMSFIEKNGCDPVAAEYTVMKTSHAELGAYLLGLWGIPGNIVESVAFHHNPSKLLEDMYVMLYELSREALGTRKAKDVDLRPGAVKKYATEFTALTAVHIANAMMMQENLSSDTTISPYPYVDMLYLRTLNLTDKLSGWKNFCKNAMQLEDIKYV